MLASHEVTRLLQELSSGNPDALSRLIPLVYDQLRKLAASQFERERRDHTLQPTALVHEAYIRLLGQHHVHWQSRAHFVGLAAHLMRRILIDHARSHLAAKRGGLQHQITLDESLQRCEPEGVDILALDAALERLTAIDPQQGRIVELRFFGGLTVEETAVFLKISPATVKRDWRLAKAWLYRETRETRGARP
jgi:RNA polymerase sigma-70 factor (ECF subfamily)